MSEWVIEPGRPFTGPAEIALCAALASSRAHNSAEIPALVDAYAHELAEKIRVEARKAKTLRGPKQGIQIRFDRLSEAADFIDPEVDD